MPLATAPAGDEHDDGIGVQRRDRNEPELVWVQRGGRLRPSTTATSGGSGRVDRIRVIVGADLLKLFGNKSTELASF